MAFSDTATLLQDSANAIESGTNVTNKGIFSANMLRVAKSVFGYGSLAFGAAFSIEMTALALIDKKYKKVPTLNDFANKVLGKFSWPYLDEAQIKGAELSGALLIYLDIPQS